MSRLDGRAVEVACDERGRPSALRASGDVRPLPVCGVLDRWREWVGVLGGEPERDVWLVETPRGVCELHNLRYPTDDGEEAGDAVGDWLLYRWLD